jgi:pilus assembly protein CpaD
MSVSVMRSTPRLLASLALLATLGACASATVPDENPVARTTTEQFQAKVNSTPNEIRLAVHAQGLSANQADAIAGFVAEWRETEAGVITLQTPNGGPDAGAAFRTSEGARSVLIGEGVPAGQIRLVGYDARGQAAAPLLIGYLRYEAEPLHCGEAWTNMAESASNQVQPNFGCAVTANIAAQVANPADLLGPRTMTPADASRRQVVIDKYRKGEVTASAENDQAKGVISDAIK